MAVDLDGGRPSVVHALATVDIVIDHVFGCGTETPPRVSRASSIDGWSPSDRHVADALVAPPRIDAVLVGDPAVADLLVDARIGDIPRVSVLAAAESLWRTVPSTWLRMAWMRGDDVPDGAPTRVGREALLIAELALIMLRYEPPESILALAGAYA